MTYPNKEQQRKWTLCKCGHSAQAHNVAWWNGFPDASQNLHGPMTGAEPGRWKMADINTISRWGCDMCDCTNCTSTHSIPPKAEPK